MEEKLLKVIEKHQILMLTVNKQMGIREAALASDFLCAIPSAWRRNYEKPKEISELFYCSANIQPGINSPGISEMP